MLWCILLEVDFNDYRQISEAFLRNQRFVYIVIFSSYNLMITYCLKSLKPFSCEESQIVFMNDSFQILVSLMVIYCLE